MRLQQAIGVHAPPEASLAPSVGDQKAVAPAETLVGAWPEPPTKAMIEAPQQNAMVTARVKAFHRELEVLLKRHEADVQHCLEVFFGLDAVLPPVPLNPRISHWSSSTRKPRPPDSDARKHISMTADTSAPSSAAPTKESRHRPAHPEKHDDDPESSAEAIAQTMTYVGQRKKLRGQARPNLGHSDSLLRWVSAAMEKTKNIVDEPKKVGRCRERLRGLMTSRIFEVCVIVLILLDAAHLGWKVQRDAELHRSTRVLGDTCDLYCRCYFLLTVFFVAEWGLRLFAEGRDFCKQRGWHWRFLDTFTVVSMLVELIIYFAMNNSAPRMISLIQFLRVLRVVRILRLIRVLRFFRDLRLMIESLANSIMSLMWVLIVMLLTFYMFGIVLTQGVTDYLSDNDLWDEADGEKLRKFFGSLTRSVLSLFQAMTGGISWIELMDALRPLPSYFSLLFLAFIVFAVLAMVNIVTAIFLNSALQRNEKELEMVAEEENEAKARLVEEMRSLFSHIDADGSDTVTVEELRQAMCDPTTLGYLASLDLDGCDAETLFILLDVDQQGFVDIDEFLDGCLKLKGNAKRLDLQMMSFQMQWLMHVVGKIRDLTKAAYTWDSEPEVSTNPAPKGRRLSMQTPSSSHTSITNGFAKPATARNSLRNTGLVPSPSNYTLGSVNSGASLSFRKIREVDQDTTRDATSEGSLLVGI